MKHLRCLGESHTTLHTVLAWAQLSTGMGFPLLEWPEKPVSHQECALIQSIQTGLADIGGRIERFESSVFKERRLHDCHLMDAICVSDRFTTSQVCQINGCWLFLGVTLLSDITTTCGRYVNAAYLHGEETNGINWPTVQYPCQMQPDKLVWALWRKAVHLSHL